MPRALDLPAAPRRTAKPGEADLLVYDAILMLAGQCDYASSEDDVGFSKFDTEFGHSLARSIKNYGSLRENAFPYAKKLCHKYRRQLAAADFDLDAIADAEWVDRNQKNRGKAPVEVPISSWLRETEKAVHAELCDGIDHWLPKSMCDFAEDHSAVVMPVWLAHKKGINIDA